MNQDKKELAVEMIELGVATVETKGHIGVLGDENQLTLVAHQGPFEPETAALGRRRYQAFIELVGRRIAQAAGTSNADHKSTSVSPAADASPADERD